MNNLLQANLNRLFKNRVFWLCVAVMLFLSAGVMLNGCRQAAQNSDIYTYNLDGFFFNTVPLTGMFFAVFTSLFLGTEYGDGTVRNKVAAGHTRENIYLANFLATAAASGLLLVAWFVGGLVGVPALGGFQIGMAGLAVYLGVCILFSVALTAIFTLIGMLCTNKATTAVLSMLVFLGLLIVASIMYNRLHEPEFYSGIVMTADGMQMGDPTPNPDYLRGTLRTVYELAVAALPTGQAILMANLEIARPVFGAAASVLITLIVTGAGVFFFRKKDLK